MKTITIALFTLSLVSCVNFTTTQPDATSVAADSTVIKTDSVKFVSDTVKVAVLDTIKNK